MTDRDPDEFAPRGRPSRYDDVRDDYDEDFAVVRMPRERARRKIAVPAVAFVVIGIMGIPGMGVAAVAVIDTYLNRRFPPPLPVFGLYLGLLLLAAGLFATIIFGGINLRQFRRRWLALTAAYIVTSLTLAGPYGLPFFPFGIYALIVLHQPDVREQFRRPPDSGVSEDRR